jgi:hypothetical protein
MPVSVASGQLFEVGQGQLGDGRTIAFQYLQHGRERSDLGQFGLGLDQRRYALEDVHHLRIHRVLDPQRAVLVEGGDALGGRHELRAALRRGLFTKVDDRLLGRAVVPGRQRVGLRLGMHAQGEQRRQCQKAGKRRKGRCGSSHVSSPKTPEKRAPDNRRPRSHKPSSARGYSIVPVVTSPFCIP